MSWIIYKHTNKSNGKIYIGQTCQKINDRWQSGKGYSRSRLFYNAIKKYGWDGFDHEIIEEGIKTIQEANEKEAFYIKKYKSYARLKDSWGYNMTPGGDSTGENWEEWEDDLLINNYCEIGADECLNLINKKWSEIDSKYIRSRQSIYSRAMRLKLKRPVFWNDEKDKIVKKYYPTEGRNCSKRIPGSTKKMCEWRASYLGVSYNIYWSEEELKLLNENYMCGYVKLLKLLPNKTKKQIKYQVVHLHLKKHPEFVCFETGETFSSFSQAARAKGASSSVIKKCLNDNSRCLMSGKYHWCTKEAFLNGWTPEKQPIKNAKKVYCVQTGQVFDSIAIAENATGCSGISRCCLNHACQCRNSDGKLLNWCFLEDKDTFQFIKRKISWNAKAIICIETNEKFESMKFVLEKYKNISRTTLFRALKDQKKNVGGYHWKYID